MQSNNKYHETLATLKKAEIVLQKAQDKNRKRIEYLEKIGGQEKLNEINLKRAATREANKIGLPNYIETDRPTKQNREERIKKYDNLYNNKNQPKTTDVKDKKQLTENNLRNVRKALGNSFINIKLTEENFNEVSNIEDLHKEYACQSSQHSEKGEK